MDGFVIVANVLFLILLNLLLVDDLHGGGDATCLNGLLEVVLRQDGLLLLLKCKGLSAFHVIGDRGVDGVWLVEWAAVEVVDAACEAHLGFIEDEHKAAMVSFPLAGGEATCDLGNLGDGELDGSRCGLADHLFKVLVSIFFLTILVIAAWDLVEIVAIYLFLLNI